MKNITNIILILIFTAVGIAAQEKAKVSDTSKDEAAIRANVEQMEKGWNMKSGAEFAKPFAENSDYVVINGTRIKGRAANAEGHQQIFDTIFKDSRNTATIKQIRFVRSDVAIVHVEWNLSFKASGEEQKGHALSTIMMTKENGKWEIAAFQNTEIQTN